jgi:hypothetical protein
MGETRRNFDRGLILRSDTMPELYARLLTLASEPPEDVSGDPLASGPVAVLSCCTCTSLSGRA